MKKKVFYFLTLLTSTNFLFSEENKEQPPAKKEIVAYPSETSTQTKSITVINPQDRALDYLKAFEILKKDKSTSRIFYRLTNDTTINNIIEVNALEKGTLLLFKLSTTQGIKYLIVPVEEIKEIGHL